MLFQRMLVHCLVIVAALFPSVAAAQYVTPEGDPYTGVNPNSTSNSALFTVENATGSDRTFSLSCHWSGKVTSCQGPSSVFVEAWSYAPVQVLFNAGTAGTGVVGLYLTSSVGNGHGWYNVTVTVPPTYTVAVTPNGGGVTRAASGTFGQSFGVQNVGNQSATYSFTQLCSGGGIVSCSTPSAVTLSPNASTNVTVNYSTAGSAGSGEVRLRATASGTQDDGWIGVTVEAPPPSGLPATPQLVLAGLNLGTSLERGLCLTIAAGSDAAYECGDLRLVHALPTTRTLNKTRTPTLIYNSQHARPYPLVAAHVGLPAEAGPPDSVVATISINNVERGRGKWLGNAWSPGSERRITVGFDGVNDPTGIYTYSLRVANWYGTTEYAASPQMGEVTLINRSKSVYGAGWWLAGLEQLDIRGDTLLWIGGDGSARRYLPVPALANVWTAPAMNRPDTLKWEQDSLRFVRFLPNGLRVHFGIAGEHKQTVNRLGHTTTFSYECARLTRISLPPDTAGKTYDFSYSGACGQGPVHPRLQFVDAPSNGSITRRVTLTVNDSGEVMSIKDPTDDSVRFEFGSGVRRRVSARIDRRGTTTSYTFDAGSRLSGNSIDMGPGQTAIASGFQPAETKGHPGSAVPNAVDTADVYTLFDGPRPVADAIDHTRFWVTNFGAPRKIKDAVNAETVLIYGDPSWPALLTEKRSPTNVVTRVWYNNQGLADSMTTYAPFSDARNPTTRYRWDPKWQALTALVSPEQDSVVYEYHPDNGNRLWQQDARGAASRVVFGYHNTGVETGMIASVDGPLSPPHLLYYDPVLGDLRETRSPLGFRTRYHVDAIGRDTLIATPFDSLQADSVRHRVTYDKADRILLSQTIAAVRSGNAFVDTASILTSFDGEGNALTVKRWAGPKSAGVDTLTNTYEYDRANRQRIAWTPGATPSADSVAYDQAGNVVASYTRRGHAITMEYDARGRLVERHVPLVQQAEQSFGGQSYPRYSVGFESPAEVVRFTYDILGNMLTADNRDARIRRQYYPNGMLKTDTLKILTWNRADSTRHVYGLRYEYDQNARRKTLWHPAQLAPDSAGGAGYHDLNYTYHGFGPLKAVTQIATHELWYDLEGRVDSIARPGVYEKRIYDADGRLTRRIERGVSFQGYNRNNALTDTIHSDLYSYDARGKATMMVSMRDSLTYEYNGLGHVAETYARQLWNPNSPDYLRETFTTDGLGNRYRDQMQTYGGQIVRYSLYQPTTGRLTRSLADGLVDTDTSTFDAAGNLVTLDRTRFMYYHSGTVGAYKHDWQMSFYDAEGRLRVVDRRTEVDNNINYRPREKGGFEEYRYDPLGRRVLMRVQRDSAGLLDYGLIERYVWDQDQLLYEIRYPGGGQEFADSLERDTSTVATFICVPHCAGDPEATTYYWRYSPHYGRVMYTHALGIDAPLSIVRFGFGQDSTLFEPFVIYPHTDHRGQYDIGTFGTGSSQHYRNGTAVQIEWPAPNTRTFQEFRSSLPEPVSWIGGLIDQQRTPSGNLYMRNRYYDPVTGRFTQEDPIGLAAGLNLYGYANGDPVNLSDPFGLKPCYDASGKAIPCPEPVGGPPIPLPGGRTWEPAGGGSTPTKTGDTRGKRWVPSAPIPGGVPQPGSSWDPELGHWDVDNLPGSKPGKKGRRRFDADGTEVTHDGDQVIGPQQFPPPTAEQAQAAGAIGGAALAYIIIRTILRFTVPATNLVPVP